MDLIEEYFKRDLTEKESAELAVLLASSLEVAELFAKTMKTHYVALGLPQPAWKPKPYHPPHHGGLKLGLKALKIGAKAFKVGGLLKLSVVAATVTVASLASYKTYQVYETKKAALPPVTVSAPTPPPARYQQLSVNIELPKAGLVTVKVFDEEDKPVKTLYAGVLPAGKRAFLWDGKKEDGTVADSGTYFIKVQSGRSTMKREIHLQGD
jgi:hypothetical protein